MTICVECKHHYYDEGEVHDLDTGVTSCWSCNECHAIKSEPRLNYITGEMDPVDTEYPPCWQVNTDGNCPHFEAKT